MKVKELIKKLKGYTLCTLLMLAFLAGCSELSPNGEKFVVRKMEKHDKIYRYKLLPTKGGGVLFINSTNFYDVGDTLILKSKRK